MKSLGRAAGRNPGIDWMKLLAAWMVIAIHTYPFQSVSGTAEILFTRTACRLAVPFFFLVTGFYVIPRCMERDEGLRRTGKWFGKTTAMYGIAILLYLPVNWYAGRLAGGISPGKILREVVWNGTFYHLWYFPAVLTGMALSLSLVRILGKNKALAVTAVLYIIGLLGDSYYGITAAAPPLRQFYEGLWNWMDYTRNGLFFAPVFLCLGACSAMGSAGRNAAAALEPELYGEKAESREHTALKYGIGTAVFTVLLLAEGWLVHRFSLPRHDSMYVLLLPAAWFLFAWVRTWRVPPLPGGKDLPMLIYLLHPLCIIGIRGAADVLHMEKLLVDNSLAHYAAVTLSATALSAILIYLRYLWKKGGRLGNGKGKTGS